MRSQDSVPRPQVVSLAVAGLVSYANTEVLGGGGGGGGGGESKNGVKVQRAGGYTGLHWDPLLLSGPSLCFVRWCEDFRQLYIQLRSAAWGSFVNDFQFPSVSDFHNLLLLQHGLYCALIFGPRDFHLRKLLHWLEPYVLCWLVWGLRLYLFRSPSVVVSSRSLVSDAFQTEISQWSALAYYLSCTHTPYAMLTVCSKYVFQYKIFGNNG